MKVSIVFQAYKRARDRMETAAYFRERQRGIAVNSDHWALEWQRWERRAKRSAKWLTRFLEGLE